MPHLIDDPEQTAEVADALGDEPRIAFDAEGDGLFRYRVRLCTAQLAGAERIEIIDTLAVSPRILTDLLGARGPEKVIHDASFDVRLLRDQGVRLGRLFDTSVAARYLGEKATGLAKLLEAHLGVKVDKGEQHADWGRRPLPEKMLRYLEDDVRHLLPLAEKLEAALKEAGIEAEFREECAWVVSSADDEPPDPREPWMRIKGARDLPRAEQAILREAADVRERAAESMDVPPFKVAPNAALIEVARRRPKSAGKVGEIRGLHKGRARRIVRDLADAVKRGLDAGGIPDEVREVFEPKGMAPAEREKKRALESALKKWRTKAAKERGVDLQVVLPGHCVSDIVAREPRDEDALAAIPGLGEARMERHGEALLRVIRGALG